MISFEAENSRAYTLLLRIEIILRERLKSALEEKNGKRWQKQLPGELLAKIRKAQTEESKPQFEFIRLGPLYYLTFGELLTLLQQKTGKPVADAFGGEVFLKQLENLFIPRNAVCHSRPVSSNGLQVTQALYAQMEAALSQDGIKNLIANPDVGITQLQFANSAISSLQKNLKDLAALPSALCIPEVYDTALSQYWWADNLLAGFDRVIIESLFTLIHEYNSLPKGVGSVGDRQRFNDKTEFGAKMLAAIHELEKVTV